jgi:hypothetical protein
VNIYAVDPARAGRSSTWRSSSVSCSTSITTLPAPIRASRRTTC